MNAVQPTDADRRMVEPIVEYAATSDLPEWALTAMRGRAALLVATLRGELLDLIDDLIRDNDLTCDPHPDNERCVCSTARALRVLNGEQQW